MDTIEVISQDIFFDEETLVTKNEIALLIRNKQYCLWYEVDKKWERAFCPDICDGVVVTFLSHALRHNCRIVSDIPMSKELHYKLTHHVIPQICRGSSLDEESVIDIPCIDRNHQGECVATGISCGVDSLTTLCEYTQDCEDDSDKITHLLYFKVGAHDGQLDHYDPAAEEELFRLQLDHAKNFCTCHGYPLIVVNSNLNEVFCAAFGFESFELTETFRNTGTVLMIQGIMRKYYYASTYGFEMFKVDLNASAARYSKWLLPYLSTNKLEMYETNRSWSRIDKERIISNFPPSYDSLLVCWMNGENCGICDKCLYTLVAFDYLGCLQKYSSRFNVEEYLKNREKLLARVFNRRNQNPYFRELCEYAECNGLYKPSVFSRVGEKITVWIPEMISRTLKHIKKQGVKQTLSRIRGEM